MAFREKDTEQENRMTTKDSDEDEISKKELNKRRNSEDIRLLERFKGKPMRNVKLNRSFSMRLEEAEKEAVKENEKSSICIIN